MSRRAISLATGVPDVLLRLEGDAVLVLTTHDGIDELEEHWSRII